METLAPMASPARQPFGVLDGTRLRNLGNAKNRQNALPLSFASPAKKRSAPVDDLPDADSENVDPALFSPSKKSKGTDGFALKPARPQQFILKANGTTHTTPTASNHRPILTPKRLTLSTSTKTVSSAPAVAGRSPQKKRASILSRRRVSASPFTRVDPPAFGSSSASTPSNGLPFSIDAALSGTVPSSEAKAKPAPAPAPRAPITDAAAELEEHMPQGWLFDIHEDTPDEELGNLMQHSTQTLDLSSDDEAKVRARDARGKENVPPDESFASTGPRAATRKDLMTDEPRTPLGDLDARDFYADGCDARSFIVVSRDREEDGKRCGFGEIAAAEAAEESVRTPCPVEGPGANQDMWENLLAQVDANSTNTGAATTEAAPPAGDALVEPSAAEDSPPTIEIWESESAKDETEDREQPVITVTETLDESMRAAEAAEAEAVERAL